MFCSRYECYKCITDILDELLLLSQTHPTSPAVPTHPGPPAQTDPNRLSSLESKTYVSITQLSSSLFHSTAGGKPLHQHSHFQ